MELREYLFRKRIKIAEFARKIKYNRTHITMVVNGQSKPSKRLMETIVEATEGQVTKEDLLKSYETENLGETAQEEKENLTND